MIKKMVKLTRNKRGFTLVELMVVVAIIMILILIAVPALKGAQDHARIATDRASIKTINNCIMLHTVSNNIDSLEGKTSMSVPQPIKNGDNVATVVQYLIDKKLLKDGTKIFFPIGHSYNAAENEVN